jgi:hypothetical protein
LHNILVKITKKLVKFSTFCKVLKPRPDLGWGLGLVRLCYHASLIRSRIAKVSLCFLWLFATSKKIFSTILEKCVGKMNFLIYQDCKERSTRGCMGAKLRATQGQSLFAFEINRKKNFSAYFLKIRKFFKTLKFQTAERS